MKIKEIKEIKIWEDFLLGCEEKTFLQSWNWGEFNKKMGNKIWRLGIYARRQQTINNKELIAVALALKIQAKRGTFLLVPHGPIITQSSTLVPRSSTELGRMSSGRGKLKTFTPIPRFGVRTSDLKLKILEILLDKLKKIAKGEKANFIRISPVWEKNKENIEIFRKLGFRNAPIHAHPEATWELDIKIREEELLLKMRKTTRYLIRQAIKNQDIKIFQSQKIGDIKIFNKLYQEVTRRHRFAPFSLDYLKNEFLAFQPDNQISLFFGEYKGKIIASAFVIFWSNKGFYHHAALSSKYPKIPIAYLLQWEAIKQAKIRKCQKYDFWGYVSPKENPKHPWAGPTLFKMGFGGSKKEYVKTQDFCLSKKYWLTYIFEKLRKIKRGF